MTETMNLKLCTFNNKGYPRIDTALINKGDYMVRDKIKPDILMEQERWHVTQWPGFAKIFADHGYETHRPKRSAISGTIVASKKATTRSVFQFTKLAHLAVPYICNYRDYTGEIVYAGGNRIPYASVHLTPSAFSARFPDGSARKLAAQKAWYGGMGRIKDFAVDQIQNGKADLVILGGDFNAKRWRVEKEFGTSLAGKPVTIYTSKHGLEIDHIIVIGKHTKVSEGFLPGTPSDHAPFWATIRIAVKTPAPTPVPPTPEPAPTPTPTPTPTPGTTMKLITRAQWGARPRGATAESHPIGATKGITAHWEGPHMGIFSHARCHEHVRGIEKFHRDTRGWADIAYNAIVCPHGYVFECRGLGVKSAANGTTQANEDYYAVCYLGGERDPFTEEGKTAFLDAFGWLRDEGNAGAIRNGHRDHKATMCPGDEIYRWVTALAPGAGNSSTNEGDWFEMASKEELQAAVREELVRIFGDNQKDKNPDAPDIGNARVVNSFDPTEVWNLGQLLFYIKDKLDKHDAEQ